jgi:hypothetical protein
VAVVAQFLPAKENSKEPRRSAACIDGKTLVHELRAGAQTDIKKETPQEWRVACEGSVPLVSHDSAQNSRRGLPSELANRDSIPIAGADLMQALHSWKQGTWRHSNVAEI